MLHRAAVLLRHDVPEGVAVVVLVRVREGEVTPRGVAVEEDADVVYAARAVISVGRQVQLAVRRYVEGDVEVV